MTYRSGGEGGILTQPLLLSYHVFSNFHENRINTSDFYDLAFFNSFNPFALIAPISGQNRHQRYQTKHRERDASHTSHKPTSGPLRRTAASAEQPRSTGRVTSDPTAGALPIGSASKGSLRPSVVGLSGERLTCVFQLGFAADS